MSLHAAISLMLKLGAGHVVPPACVPLQFAPHRLHRASVWWCGFTFQLRSSIQMPYTVRNGAPTDECVRNDGEQAEDQSRRPYYHCGHPYARRAHSRKVKHISQNVHEGAAVVTRVRLVTFEAQRSKTQ